MGDKFAFVFDIVVVLIPLIFAFVGLKRGFAKVVLGLVATAVAFACAMFLSKPIANAVYKNFIEKAIEEKLDGSVSETLESFKVEAIANADFSKIKIGGVPVDEIDIDYAGTRKAVIDLSDVDISETGITKEDLKKLGVSEDIDLSSLNAKTVEVSMDDVKEYGLGQVAAAQYIAVNVMKRPDMEAFNDAAEVIGKYLPTISGSATSDNMGVSAVRTATLKMFETKGNLKDAVMVGVIEPNCVMVIRTIAFAVIFIVVSLVLRIITAAAKLVNKIPVLGKVNAALGLVLGLIEGVIAVFIVCLVARLIVSLGGANFILFNQSSVDSTVIFKHIYNFDFLNFLT